MSSNPMARVVERQMRNWELARSQRLKLPEPKRQEVEDFVCVSRRVATPGAEEVAARLGKKLGWPVFDKEILEAMAGDDFYRQQIYANMDQRDLSWTEDESNGRGPTQHLLALVLGDATADPDSRSGNQYRQLADATEDLLDRFLAHRAGVQ